MENIRHIIESLLFVAEEPLSIAKFKSILEISDTKEIKTALHALADQYEARGGGFELSEVAGGWQLRSRPEYNEWIKRLLQPSPQRLSKAALETLAIVAYNQPIIRADIEHIRGVDCGGILRQLMERKLVRVLGRKEIPGRPLIYATSKLFLELFDLRDLRDLPTPKEMEEMGIAADSQSNKPHDRPAAGLANGEAESGSSLNELSEAPSISDVDASHPLQQSESDIRKSRQTHPSASALQPRDNAMPYTSAASHKVPYAIPRITATPSALTMNSHLIPNGGSRVEGQKTSPTPTPDRPNCEKCNESNNEAAPGE